MIFILILNLFLFFPLLVILAFKKSPAYIPSSFAKFNLLTCRYIYMPKHENYEELYTVATFLSPLHSNLLTEAEKKSAREYLKAEVKKLEDNEEVAARETEENQREDEEDDDSDDEEDNSGVYIPGAGLLDNLNTRDLRRLGQENEFDKRCGCGCYCVD